MTVADERLRRDEFCRDAGRLEAALSYHAILKSNDSLSDFMKNIEKDIQYLADCHMLDMIALGSDYILPRLDS